MSKDGSVDTESVLLKMIAEKAMMMDGREQNLLEDKLLKTKLKEFRERMLANLLLQRELQDKIEVSESEIDGKVKSDPKLSRAKAKSLLKREKAQKLTDKFYGQLYKKRRVQKLSANFGRVVRIHQRLLRPREGQRMRFIKKKYVEEELTPEEKNLVLATFDGGKMTLEDWFYALCRPSPPRRPKDLHTEKGVER